MHSVNGGRAEDDFARGRVSESETASGLHLALIIVGGTIGFALFIVAAQIGGALGYSDAALAFTLGCLVLGIMGAATSYVGARTRYSTYLLTEFAFGVEGAKIANLAVAASLIGWFGVISNTLGQATQQMLLEAFGLAPPPSVTIIAASMLIVSIAVAGFTGIDRLALVLVPFMVLFMIYAAWRSMEGGLGAGVMEGGPPFTMKTAISAVIGTYIAGVVTQPDYSRFAVKEQHAIWSVFIALGVLFPVILYLAAVPAMALGEPNILTVMATLGLVIPAFLLLFLGAWSSNVLTLYSSSLSIATILTKVRLKRIVIGAATLGTALALVPAQTYLIHFLVLLSITIPPIGAIYLVEAFGVRKFQFHIANLQKESKVNGSALFAWLCASAAGYLSQNGVFGVTGIASLDSIAVSGGLYFVLARLAPRPRRA